MGIETKLEGKDNRGNSHELVHTFLNDDDPVLEGQGHQGARLIDTKKYQKQVEQVYEYLKMGMEPNEILPALMVDDDEMTETRFIPLLRHAYVYADNTLHKNREYIFRLHMSRYEKIYRECMEMVDKSNRPLNPKTKDWSIMVGKYVGAMKALKSKEELLGLHDKSFVIEFNDHKAVVVNKEDNHRGLNVPGYDLSRLSLEEQIELLSLIKEIRTVPITGVQRVVIKRTVVQITEGNMNMIEKKSRVDDVKTIDIEFQEELPEDVVSKFKKIKPEPEPEIPKLSDNVVIDGRDEDVKKHVSKTGEEVVSNFNRNSVFEDLKKKLKK